MHTSPKERGNREGCGELSYHEASFPRPRTPPPGTRPYQRRRGGVIALFVPGGACDRLLDFITPRCRLILERGDDNERSCHGGAGDAVSGLHGSAGNRDTTRNMRSAAPLSQGAACSFSEILPVLV